MSPENLACVDAVEDLDEPTSPIVLAKKPRLMIEDCNPDLAIAALRDIFVGAGGLYDRGVPVRLAFDQMQQGNIAQAMTPDALVLEAHAKCRPYVRK